MRQSLIRYALLSLTGVVSSSGVKEQVAVAVAGCLAAFWSYVEKKRQTLL